MNKTNWFTGGDKHCEWDVYSTGCSWVADRGLRRNLEMYHSSEYFPFILPFIPAIDFIRRSRHSSRIFSFTHCSVGSSPSTMSSRSTLHPLLTLHKPARASAQAVAVGYGMRMSGELDSMLEGTQEKPIAVSGIRT